MIESMKLIVAVVLGVGAAAAGAAQQAFPTKPVRVIISTTAGSQPDSIVRVIGQKLSERWGKPVVIDNRSGAGGIIAATLVAKAAPDGHTLLYSLPNFTITPTLQANVPYDPLKEFAGIGQIGYSTNVLVVTPTLGVKTLKEFIAYARARPGKLVMGTSTVGSAGHLSSTRFNVITGIKAVQVAFKGGPEATIEILGGRAQYHVSTMGVSLPFIQDGKLVALAVTTPNRATVLPDVPALGETLPEFRQPETSHMLLAPAGTPRTLLAQLNSDLARAMEAPEVKDRMQGIAFVAAPTTPEECGRLLRNQLETLTKLVAAAGLRPK